MARERKKTEQIGVRFDKDLLEGVMKGDLAGSPQKALNLYEKSYVELVDLKVKNNNEPANKEEIKESRETPNQASQEAENPLTENETTEPPKPETNLQRIMRENREKFSKK